MSFTLDLDAARRETEHPDGIDVVFAGNTYTLPAELPLDVIDVLVSDELGLVDLLRATIGDGTVKVATGIVNSLLSEGNLPRHLLEGFYRVLEALFGPEQWASFRAARPSTSD
ncbi:MAG TPA: hypothetical protein VFP72_15450, partial [Kineosporiaceae bacterium]|nr:hypothetical protein [Kineosporiaceae bacterium]